ncbi:MAG: hypothetical protein ACMUJM_24725 [bacterium]
MKNKKKRNKFKQILIASVFVIAVILVAPYSLLSNKAFISDYIVGCPYEVVSVDGKPAERAKHGVIITVVPLVKVSAGRHTLTLQEKDMYSKNINDPIENFIINVEARKRYRLNKVNGLPVIELEK